MKTHAIITFTRNHLLINEKENGLLKRVGPQDWFETEDGQKIKGSAIAEIIPITEYYNRFPDMRPYEVLEWNNSKEYQPIERTAEQNQENFRSLLEGLKKFCVQNPGAFIAHALYKKKLNRYKQLYGKNK